MREIHTHRTNACNGDLDLFAVDESGPGGASHEYSICVPNGEPGDVRIKFQKGPLGEAGPNGITNEVLLAIVIDRLQGFQAGKFACRENALALTKLQEAMHWLQDRTAGRVARGVEGTHNV